MASEEERERENEQRWGGNAGSKLLSTVGSNDDECLSWQVPRSREQRKRRDSSSFRSEDRPISTRGDRTSTFLVNDPREINEPRIQRQFAPETVPA